MRPPVAPVEADRVQRRHIGRVPAAFVGVDGELAHHRMPHGLGRVASTNAAVGQDGEFVCRDACNEPSEGQHDGAEAHDGVVPHSLMFYQLLLEQEPQGDLAGGVIDP